MRLDQFVSQSTGMPRSEAVKVIRWGQVRVNGENITKTSTHIDPASEVLLDEEKIVLLGSNLFDVAQTSGRGECY